MDPILLLMGAAAIAIVSLAQGTLTWLVLRLVLTPHTRLWIRSVAISLVLDTALVLLLVADERLHLDRRLFDSRGPPALAVVVPVLMALSWLAYPWLDRGAGLRRLIVSQALVATTVAFFVLSMLLFHGNPFAS